MRFIRLLNKQGKNSIVGLVQIGEKKYIFKISRNIDFSIVHEYNVLRDLNSVSGVPIHWPHAEQLIRCSVKKDYYNSSDPFSNDRGRCIKVDCLLVEYIRGRLFYDMIIRGKLSKEQIQSVICQVVLILCILKTAVSFTHYDLHLRNIMVVECKESFLTYEIAGRDITIQTHGVRAIIIDFGLSFSKSLIGRPLSCCMKFTNIGCICTQNSEHYDYAFFLSVAREHLPFDIRKFYPQEHLLSQAIGLSAADNVAYVLSGSTYDSSLFTRNISGCIDIIKYLLISPPASYNYIPLKSHYKIAAEEFSKIEQLSTCTITNMYLFKGIIELVVKHAARVDNSFKGDIFHMFESTGSFLYPKTFDLERFVAAVLECSKCIGGIMHQSIYLVNEELESVHIKHSMFDIINSLVDAEIK